MNDLGEGRAQMEIGSDVVYLVDDSERLREQLSTLFESVRLEVKGFANAEDFLQAIDATRPACVIMDVRLPGMSGIDLLGRIGTDNLRLPAIVLSAVGDVETAVRCVKQGALDYFVKPCNEQRLLERVLAAIRGSRECMRLTQERDEAQALLEKLSPRELEVIQMVSSGYSNKEIAGKLDLSDRTVEKHRFNAQQKLGLRSGEGLSRLLQLSEQCTEKTVCTNATGVWCPQCRSVD